MDKINKLNEFNKSYESLKELRSKHSNLKKPLDNRCKEQEYIFEIMTKGFESEDIEGCKTNLEQLKDNSKHIREMMKQQNEHIQTSITIAEKTLNILCETKTLSCLRDYISEFIVIIVDELTQECWNKLNRAFNEKIRKNKVDFGRNYANEISRLKAFLVDYDITIEEFELLLRFKKKSNVEFHRDDNQTEDDAKQLIKSIPEKFKEYKVPLMKVVNALE